MTEPGIAGQPLPDAGLRPERGHHKVFLGMAAGVGKTYRMLQEGRAEAEAGRDVVIGYLEPHHRPDTTAQAAGLEVVPRRRVVYRDVELEEMDLPGILARRPELCLIDELAHTNAPGVEHAKRYDDVHDVLGAGIDVFSTVNVQHLESINDQVAELTTTRVRETLPDSVLGEADEVVLIDLTPEALIQRLRAGKVYPGERIETALNNFFKIENLAALREVALRQVAETVEAKRLVLEPTPSRHDHLIESAAPQAVGERLLALVKPTPKSQRVVRRAWRSSQRLGAELDLLWVSSGEPTAGEREQLDALRRLATLLGAHLLVERDGDVAEAVRRVVAERGTTYVLMGTPKPRSALRRLARPALPFRLLQLLPGIDLRIVADRSRRTTEDRE
jgi:two-component system sensor histidine kinase KdpD